MGQHFSSSMITGDLRNQVIRALISKTGLSFELCEEYVSEASMRILRKHQDTPLEIENSLFQYWLTSSFYVFLEEKRKHKGISFISEPETSQGEGILERIPDYPEKNPEHVLISQKKMRVLEEIGRIIRGLPSGCNQILTLYMENENQLVSEKPHRLLNITPGAFYTRVNRCKSQLKKTLLQMSCFKEYWYLIAERREI